MDLHKNILAIWESKRIKQSEMAHKLDIDQSNYARLEKRGNKLTLEQVGKIAEALGVSVLELIDESKQGTRTTQSTSAHSDDLRK